MAHWHMHSHRYPQFVVIFSFCFDKIRSTVTLVYVWQARVEVVGVYEASERVNLAQWTLRTIPLKDLVHMN